eukprot:Tbor_TRINITY_DN4498_c0_g1::TRINITY_DN4498_c0_g1_i1::g.8095::m.8095
MELLKKAVILHDYYCTLYLAPSLDTLKYSSGRIIDLYALGGLTGTIALGTFLTSIIFSVFKGVKVIADRSKCYRTNIFVVSKDNILSLVTTFLVKRSLFILYFGIFYRSLTPDASVLSGRSGSFFPGSLQLFRSGISCGVRLVEYISIMVCGGCTLNATALFKEMSGACAVNTADTLLSLRLTRVRLLALSSAFSTLFPFLPPVGAAPGFHVFSPIHSSHDVFAGASVEAQYCLTPRDSLAFAFACIATDACFKKIQQNIASNEVMYKYSYSQHYLPMKVLLQTCIASGVHGAITATMTVIFKAFPSVRRISNGKWAAISLFAQLVPMIFIDTLVDKVMLYLCRMRREQLSRLGEREMMAEVQGEPRRRSRITPTKKEIGDDFYRFVGIPQSKVPYHKLEIIQESIRELGELQYLFTPLSDARLRAGIAMFLTVGDTIARRQHAGAGAFASEGLDQRLAAKARLMLLRRHKENLERRNVADPFNTVIPGYKGGDDDNENSSLSSSMCSRDTDNTAIKVDNDTEDKPRCTVCLGTISDARKDDYVVVVACKHEFHTNCLLSWLFSDPHCPLCHTPLIAQEPTGDDISSLDTTDDEGEFFTVSQASPRLQAQVVPPLLDFTGLMTVDSLEDNMEVTAWLRDPNPVLPPPELISHLIDSMFQWGNIYANCVSHYCILDARQSLIDRTFQFATIIQNGKYDRLPQATATPYIIGDVVDRTTYFYSLSTQLSHVWWRNAVYMLYAYYARVTSELLI